MQRPLLKGLGKDGFIAAAFLYRLPHVVAFKASGSAPIVGQALVKRFYYAGLSGIGKRYHIAIAAKGQYRYKNITFD